MSDYYRYKKKAIKKSDIQLYIQKDVAVSVRLNSVLLKAFDKKCKTVQTSRNEMINQLIRNWLFKNNVRIESKQEIDYGEDWLGEGTDKHLWKRI